MTIDDLMNIFERAVAKAAPFPQHHEDGIYEGIRAVVTALRDEMCFWTKDCHACDRANDTFNEILTSDGEEAGPDAGSHYTFCDHPAADLVSMVEAEARKPVPYKPGFPAAAPVCEWEPDGQSLWFAHCDKQMGHRSYPIAPTHCPSCGLPISIKSEAAR